MRVDDQDASLANNEPIVVNDARVGQECVDAFRQLKWFELDATWMKRWYDEPLGGSEVIPAVILVDFLLKATQADGRSTFLDAPQRVSIAAP